MGNKVIAYKGFNSDLTCRGYQYEVGKTHIYEGDIQICKQGFHACENPLDVLDTDYYSIDNKFCEVEVDGDIQKEDKKLVCSSIKLTAEIGFIGLFKAGIEWLKQVTNPQAIIDNTKIENQSGDSAQIGSSGDSAQIGSSGDYAQIGSSGNSAQIGSSGDYAQIGSSGYYAQIGSSGDYAKIGSSGNSAQIGSSGDYAKMGSSGDSAQIGSSGNSAQIGSSGDSAKIDSTGEGSVICCAGANSVVKAKVGSWITLAEWKYSEEKRRNIPVCVKTEYVDGERIKEDTFYTIKNGKFVEVCPPEPKKGILNTMPSYIKKNDECI